MYADSYSCKRQDASFLDLRVGGRGGAVGGIHMYRWFSWGVTSLPEGNCSCVQNTGLVNVESLPLVVKD